MIGTLLAVSLLLQPPQSSGWSEAVRGFYRLCEKDSAPRWLQPEPAVDRLLVLAPVADLSEGRPLRLLPSHQYFITSDEINLLKGLDIPTLDILLSGRGPRGVGFGPEIAGLYRLSLSPLGSPECAEWSAFTARMSVESERTREEYDFAPAGRCPVYTRIGDQPEIDAYSHVFISYEDRRARTAGIFRFVTELRSTRDIVYARQVNYVFDSTNPTCPQNANHDTLSDLIGDSN